MVEMRVFGLTIDPQTKTPIVILREMEGETVLPVWVGAMEAMAVSLVLNKENLPRPLTHDLLLMALRALKAGLVKVEITDLKDGVFFALLVLQGPGGRVRVDCRPSDAIALAMRAEAPIMVNEDVLRRAAEAQEKAEQRLHEEVLSPVPDAATDMVRKAGARKEADMLHSRLLHGTVLSDDIDPEEERRFREMLRSLEPISRRKM
ncbi:bifunctional nuclease family protein [Desulfovibrio falkowii]|uniref:BFN domain-containing protein n=2 Tax=Desulfovibrio TaxID=872 RepID=B8J0A0_DESDA|nr:bifunctional nuclease family protein [uncultured Desulfovibrio sp.]MDY0202884.1 bifunctional nuclease family protein [Desulfovibrio desulfuricans]